MTRELFRAVINNVDMLIRGSLKLNRTYLKIEDLLNKSQHSLSRHSGASQYPLPPSRGKVGWGFHFWMLVFTSMTEKVLKQWFLKQVRQF